MFTTRLFSRRQKMLLKMKVLYCRKLPQRPKFPHLTVQTIQQHGWVTMSIKRWYNYISIPKLQRCNCWSLEWISNFTPHDVQFSGAINQPLLTHHWRVHQCLLTSRFTAPLIPWGASALGGKIRKQLLKDHNFLNNSPIFIIESSTILGRELGPSGVSPNQNSRWKLAFSPLKHV